MNDSTTRRDFLKYATLVAGGTVAAPWVLSACSGGAGGGAAADTYKIGAVLELSGADSAGGQLAQRGYQFWADTVNKAGGIKVGGKQYKVQVLSEDCQSQPSVAADAATRLISQQKVDALFGSYTSGVQLALNPIAAKYQVPCIAGSAESPGNWTSQPPYTYGIIPSVDLTADKALKLIVDTATPKPTTAAIVGANEPFSKDAAAGFAAGAEQAGLKVTENSLFPPAADLSPIVSSIASANPDIVAVGGHDTILINFAKACKAIGFAPKALIMHYGVTEPAFVQALGGLADGVLGLVDWTPDFDYRDDVFGTAQEFATNYKAQYKTDVDYTGAGCAVSGEVLQLALDKVGKGPGLSQDDRVKLNQAIAQTDITTFYGPIKFDASGSHFHDNTQPPPLLVQVQQGKLVAVAPADVKKGSLVYPRAV
jgi:branched-chain amino acid transport system substrate-binding protein